MHVRGAGAGTEPAPAIVTAVKRPAGENPREMAAVTVAGQMPRASSRPYSEGGIRRFSS